MTKIALLTPNLMGMEKGINRIQPSLGVGYLAGVLRQRGHEVFMRDTALEHYDRVVPNSDGKTVTIGESEESTAAWLSEVNPDYVGISVLFSNLAAHAHQIAAISKRTVPNAKVILGGNHVTNSALDFKYFTSKGKTAKLDAIQDPNVDFAMRGEVDFDLADLVHALSDGKPPYGTPGLIYKTQNGEIKINETSGRLKNMDDLPFPARDLMNMEGYFKIGRFHSANPRSNRVGSVMASRGCPEHCSFCTTPETWGNVVRWRSPENVYREIKGLKEDFKIGEIHFEDDTLTANSVNLEKLCEKIEPLGLSWCTPNGTKVNYHSRNPEKQYQLFKKMKDSGCYQITFAIESGVQRVLDHVIRKGLPLETVLPTIERAKKAGLFVHTFWVVGSVGETREEMEKSIEFAEGCGADSYSISILSPLPGTSQYRESVEQNLWWTGELDPKDIIYRKSLVKAEGFRSSEEFEAWVNEKNHRLNSKLKEYDPQRFKEIYGMNSGARLLVKQT